MRDAADAATDAATRAAIESEHALKARLKAEGWKMDAMESALEELRRNYAEQLGELSAEHSTARAAVAEMHEFSLADAALTAGASSAAAAAAHHAALDAQLREARV